MFSPIRNRLGIPGILAVIALVFSMVGGAYAANKYIITSTSQIKPSVLKKLRGPAGPAGANGAAGATGATGQNGADGKNGTNGTNGAPGKSVVTGAEATGTGSCEGRGGVWVEVEGSGVKRYVCNGENGSSGSSGPLAAGETEAGLWSFETESHYSMMSINFPRPVESPYNTEWVTTSAAPTSNCPGSYSAPDAEPGYLCIYVKEVGGLATGEESIAGINPYTADFSLGVTGEFHIETGQDGYGTGSWAVTAGP